MQNVQNFEGAPSYQELLTHYMDPEWQTGGDRPLSPTEIEHNREMIEALRATHALAAETPVVPVSAS